MIPFTRTLLLAALSALALSACTTLDPYTGEERTARATTGAAVGAVAGAVIGAATGSDSRDRRKRALIGAGIGGLSGAAVGAYMDRQEAKLRERLQGSGVSVTRHGDDIILNMPGNVTFGFDSADLRPEFFEILDSVALVVNEFDQTLIEVAGHTDSTGSAAYNQRLSERRADTVGRYLQARDVDSRRIATAGFGEDYPIASNQTEAGRQANRRVELTLVPITR
ncbi:MAG: OmpA family protein [Ectothiorhodospiraceae bacterium]|nr:OmpA family protein [Ectothiorhodospiraceae bacterium]